jgi:hypothetical protein
MVRRLSESFFVSTVISSYANMQSVENDGAPATPSSSPGREHKAA